MDIFKRDFEPHTSHQMTDWKSGIITLVATARFGSIRTCKNCGAEHAKTVAGEAAHEELAHPCQGLDT